MRSKLGNLKKKQVFRASHANFSVSFRWALSRAHGPAAGPNEANGLPEAHGPPKVQGPRGHCPPPFLPFWRPWRHILLDAGLAVITSSITNYFIFEHLLQSLIYRSVCKSQLAIILF